MENQLSEFDDRSKYDVQQKHEERKFYKRIDLLVKFNNFLVIQIITKLIKT